MFDPLNCYWLSDDGRIFASASSSIVSKKDAQYKAWLAVGNTPSKWPLDDNGNQTDASLQAVIGGYNLYLDLPAYAAAKRYSLETGGFSFKGHPIATDATSQSKIGNVALAANIVGSGFSTSFKCSDGSFFTLDQTDALSMATAIMNFISACFDAEAGVALGITNGTIKTLSDVDTATWPSNVL
ncbi:DUF4376 domain-containing protein [Rhizobium sp. P38BS-XIX]|uniref:DUF4376 domain-containing protein n=1 Tax=Rhizobium sp. P38BS-XIX TaxID=2726740 RepID=UPI001456BA4C|nr:DUF4376 domain-containing protein [Rhizobium sp. P38BS-XIX]NLS00170.1 DUF4376 domain-containing protein [Rhizobium sp. P38BS-XIX]